MSKKKEQESQKAAPQKEETSGSPAQELTWEKEKKYSPQEAVQLTKKLSKTKFDASVEVHLRLGIDPKKGDQQVRSTVTLPHGTGKQTKVAAFVSPENQKAVKEAGADIVGGEDLIEEIKKTEKTDFDVALAEPAMMKSLSQIAKTLGTRGLMPSPKNETVTSNPAQMAEELKKGKVSFKNDNTGNLHIMIGKVSFGDQALVDNFQALIDAIKKAKPSSAKGTYLQNVSMSSTMGPGIKINIE
ncbi:MAG TPA: 50S ribosomal protein L1 [Patescibacteria group bacterium]|nr:50S ribosomal protein L1 [Patescibacteria group bacterium]